MINITVPHNNIAERRYILDTIFVDFLGLNYSFTTSSDMLEWKIKLENGNQLIFEDHFFNKYKNNLEYLNIKNIPSEINFIHNKYIIENNIPIIYGDSKLDILEDKIVCGIDIFASSFFMLSRWEECVDRSRDIDNNFPFDKSLAFLNDFLNRPIVNEYLEMMRNMLLDLDSTLEFKDRKFQLFLTHDVDDIYLWRNYKHISRTLLGDLLKRGDLYLFIDRIKEYYQIKRGKIKEPYDTFDWLMDMSESIGVKSRFYFMSGGVTKFDNRYKIDEPKALDIIDRIKKRGHIIGFHPSYNAYNSFSQFTKEKRLLEETITEKIFEGREHYLRFEVPETWQIWEDSGMKNDSTCGYNSCEGFRCGTGDEFFVFNILSQKKLQLKERPLIYMDNNRVEPISDENILITTIKELIEKSKRYKSSSTILFHQNIFASKEINYRRIYEESIFANYRK